MLNIVALLVLSRLRTGTHRKTTTTELYHVDTEHYFSERTIIVNLTIPSRNKFSLKIPRQLQRNHPNNSYSRAEYSSPRDFAPTETQYIVGFQLSATTSTTTTRRRWCLYWSPAGRLGFHTRIEYKWWSVVGRSETGSVP